MAALLKVDELRAIARTVGVDLEDVELTQEANLYVLADKERNCLYVGKAASSRRHSDEDGWRLDEYWRHNYSGFVALATENDAVRHAYRYRSEEFDRSAILGTAGRWAGLLVGKVGLRLRTGDPPSTEEVEQILIRIHVRTGRLVGNSQFASQWEGPIGSFTDAVAVLAAYNAFEDGILPRANRPSDRVNALPDAGRGEHSNSSLSS